MDTKGTVGVVLDLFARRGPGQNEVGAQARFHSGLNVGVHTVTDHCGVLGVRADLVEAGADHHRVRFADEVGAFAGGRSDHCRD